MAFREGAEKKEGTEDIERLAPEGDDDDETKVRLDDADDDSDDDGQDDGQDDGEEERTPSGKNTKPADGQPRKKDGKWAEKKAARGKERQVASRWQQEKQEYDRRIARMQEENDRRFQALQQDFDRVRQGGQQQHADPMAAKIEDIGRQLDQELKLIEADDKRDYSHYRRLQRQEQYLIAQHVAAQAAAAQVQEQRQQPQDPYAGRRPIISAEFPWTDDPRYNELNKKASAYRRYLIEVEGKPDTLDTDREALMTIQSRMGGEYGLRPPPAAPTQRTRSLYTAPASRGAPDRRPMPREVDLGELGRGTGLSPQKLAALVRESLQEE